MGKYERLLQRIVSGRSDANITFAELRHLLRSLGFQERIRGDHHIFPRNGVEEMLSLQPRKSMAKPYQVRQVRQVIVRYQMEPEDVE